MSATWVTANRTVKPMFDWDVCHDCNDLQDALDRNKEVFAPTWNESMLFAKAARLVADPNIEAAAWIVMR